MARNHEMDLRFRSDLVKPEGSLALAACWNWKCNSLSYKMVCHCFYKAAGSPALAYSKMLSIFLIHGLEAK